MKYVFAMAAAALLACGNAKPAVSPSETAKTDATDHAPKPVSTNVALSGDILAACKIEFANTEHAPKFEFDSAGRSLELIGRADPRGTEQYDLALGEHRAHEVTDFLHQHGVASRIRETSRGALDATGRDEDGWRQDRRVDLILGS